jgi:hypothetical protein
MLDLFDQWLRSEGKSTGTIKVYALQMLGN